MGLRRRLRKLGLLEALDNPDQSSNLEEKKESVVKKTANKLKKALGFSSKEKAKK